MQKNYSIISSEFQGQTKTIIICANCGYIKNKYEPFMYLSLSIPTKKEITLDDCLKEFCANDLLEGNEKWFCKKCNFLVNAYKQTEIIRLPKYLIIHLKRFKNVHSKIDDLVKYEEALDMRKYDKANESEGFCYRLYAKIKHMGCLNGGHYVALAKQDSFWFCFNDSNVDQVSFSVSADTYLLFYEKVSFDSLEMSKTQPVLIQENIRIQHEVQNYSEPLVDKN